MFITSTHVDTVRQQLNGVLVLMQHGSPPIIYSAGNAASPAIENGTDREPLQVNASRHKTYSESELAEMETGMHTTYSLWCMDRISRVCMASQANHVLTRSLVFPQSCVFDSASSCKQAVHRPFDLNAWSASMLAYRH